MPMFTLYCHAQFNPKREYQVKTLVEASAKYLEWIASGPFAVDILGEGSGVVKKGKQYVAEVSYNGKVWTYNKVHEIRINESPLIQFIDFLKDNTDTFHRDMVMLFKPTLEDTRELVMEHVKFWCGVHEELTLSPADIEFAVNDTFTKTKTILAS